MPTRHRSREGLPMELDAAIGLGAPAFCRRNHRRIDKGPRTEIVDRRVMRSIGTTRAGPRDRRAIRPGVLRRRIHGSVPQQHTDMK